MVYILGCYRLGNTVNITCEPDKRATGDVQPTANDRRACPRKLTASRNCDDQRNFVDVPVIASEPAAKTGCNRGRGF